MLYFMYGRDLENAALIDKFTFYIRMYIAADKYGIGQLKTLTESQFCEALLDQSFILNEDLASAVKLLYTEAPGCSKQMRPKTVRAIAQHLPLGSDQRIPQLIEEAMRGMADFACDLAVAIFARMQSINSGYYALRRLGHGQRPVTGTPPGNKPMVVQPESSGKRPRNS